MSPPSKRNRGRLVLSPTGWHATIERLRLTNLSNGEPTSVVLKDVILQENDVKMSCRCGGTEEECPPDGWAGIANEVRLTEGQADGEESSSITMNDVVFAWKDGRPYLHRWRRSELLRHDQPGDGNVIEKPKPPREEKPT